ncbi:MAG: HigA family addiction module antidote protein [Planctomycetes bacterium]|nr:HigA family addiction module antidote protein [Planctomycetota bacterium]
MEFVDGLPPIHPGEFVREILDELEISQASFAKRLGISPARVSLVVREQRPVTAELALLFGRAFSQSPQYWMGLQATYDLKMAEKKLRGRWRKVRAVVAKGRGSSMRSPQKSA